MAPNRDTIELPLGEFVRQVAREAAREAAETVIAEHVEKCPARRDPASRKPMAQSGSSGLSRMKVQLAFLLGAVTAGGGLGVGLERLLRMLGV